MVFSLKGGKQMTYGYWLTVSIVYVCTTIVYVMGATFGACALVIWLDGNLVMDGWLTPPMVLGLVGVLMVCANLSIWVALDWHSKRPWTG